MKQNWYLTIYKLKQVTHRKTFLVSQAFGSVRNNGTQLCIWDLSMVIKSYSNKEKLCKQVQLETIRLPFLAVTFQMTCALFKQLYYAQSFYENSNTNSDRPSGLSHLSLKDYYPGIYGDLSNRICVNRLRFRWKLRFWKC